MKSSNPSDGIPQDQNKIIDEIDISPFIFERIPLNLRNGFKCCFEDCYYIPTYYLKCGDHVIERFCKSCKEIHEGYALDNYDINNHHKKRKLRKSIDRLTKTSTIKKERVIRNCHQQ